MGKRVLPVMVPFIGDCLLFINDGVPYRRWQSLSYYFSKFNNLVISYHYVFELVYFSIGVVWYDRNHNISNVTIMAPLTL